MRSNECLLGYYSSYSMWNPGRQSELTPNSQAHLNRSEEEGHISYWLSVILYALLPPNDLYEVSHSFSHE